MRKLIYIAALLLFILIESKAQHHTDTFYAAGNVMNAISNTTDCKKGYLAIDVIPKPSDGTDGCSSIIFRRKNLKYLHENLHYALGKYKVWKNTAINEKQKELILDIDPVYKNALCTGSFIQHGKFCVAVNNTTNIRFCVTTENNITQYRLYLVTGYMHHYDNRYFSCANSFLYFTSADEIETFLKITNPQRVKEMGDRAKVAKQRKLENIKKVYN